MSDDEEANGEGDERRETARRRTNDEGNGDDSPGVTAASGPDGVTSGWRGGATRGGPAEAVATIRAVYQLAIDTQISFLAAAIAYYAFVSTVPLVALGVVVATTLGGDALADRLVSLAGSLLEPAGEELLRAVVTARTGLGGVTVTGTVVLLWGAIKAFRALDHAFSLLYGTGSTTSVTESFGDALVALSAVGVGTFVMLFIGAAVAVLPGPFTGPIGALIVLATLVVVFLPLYYLFPDTDVAVRDVVTGAALAALGWTVLGAVFGVYAASFAGASVYGLLGGVILALTWFYLGALLLLLGGAVNAVRSGHAPRADQ